MSAAVVALYEVTCVMPPVLATAASGFRFWFNWMLLPSAAVKMRPLPPVAAVTPPSWVE